MDFRNAFEDINSIQVMEFISLLTKARMELFKDQIIRFDPYQ